MASNGQQVTSVRVAGASSANGHGSAASTTRVAATRKRVVRPSASSAIRRSPIASSARNRKLVSR
jgi:hypothetical protein